MPDVNVMVLYDISDDQTRTRMIEHLEYLGLHRIQFSVFKGKVPKKRFSQIISGSRAICTEKEDRVLIVPLCASCINRIVSIHDNYEEYNHSSNVI